MAELDWTEMPKHQAFLNDWTTPEILAEGSLGCAKTTLALDKEINALLRWPGIPILLFRWSEDATATKLKPAWEELLTIRGVPFEWDAKQKRYTFENGSTAFMFGLKAISEVEIFNKIRGLGVNRATGDQVEEMKQSVAQELRGRLRPDLTATLSGRKFPFQLTFVANCEDEDFWLSKEFPIDNHIKGRKVYSFGVNDNKHLPQETIESLWRTYPIEHPKNLTLVQGKRGPNITGDPVYEGLYRRDTHKRPTAIRPDATILEAFECGKHNPVWIFAQTMHAGGVSFIGGIRGQELMLEDFLPIVKHYRAQWLPFGATVKTCASAMGAKTAMFSAGLSWQDIFKQAGYNKIDYRDGGNSGDVVLALIELISGLLRRRTVSGEEAIAVNDDPKRWLIAARDGVRESPFFHIALEAGYVWDRHFTSVSNKELRQPREDDKFANIMHAAESLVLNYIAGKPTDAEQAAKAHAQLKAEAMQRASSLSGEHGWMAG